VPDEVQAYSIDYYAIWNTKMSVEMPSPKAIKLTISLSDIFKKRSVFIVAL
jgi:hypothetical protein